jgi:hypothetical protein
MLTWRAAHSQRGSVRAGHDSGSAKVCAPLPPLPAALRRTLALVLPIQTLIFDCAASKPTNTTQAL